MAKELIQTRAPDDLVTDIEEYQEEAGHLNRAEAIRTLLRAGLDAHTPPDEEPDDDTDEEAESDDVSGALDQPTPTLRNTLPPLAAVGAVALAGAVSGPDAALVAAAASAGAASGALLGNPL